MSEKQDDVFESLPDGDFLVLKTLPPKYRNAPNYDEAMATFAERVARSGRLMGESGHPKLRNGESQPEFLRRCTSVALDKADVLIKKVKVVSDKPHHAEMVVELIQPEDRVSVQQGDKTIGLRGFLDGEGKLSIITFDLINTPKVIAQRKSATEQTGAEI